MYFFSMQLHLIYYVNLFSRVHVFKINKINVQTVVFLDKLFILNLIFKSNNNSLRVLKGWGTILRAEMKRDEK